MFNQYTYARWGYSNYVNNIYLQLAAETGLVGAVLFIAPMIMVLIRTLRTLRQIRRENRDGENIMPYLALSLAWQLFFLLYGFFEIPFYDYTFSLYMALPLPLPTAFLWMKSAACFLQYTERMDKYKDGHMLEWRRRNEHLSFT
jgi:O-antigen ligase